MSSIVRREKICKGCGKPKYLFGHGFCEPCYRTNRGKGILGKPKQFEATVKKIKPKKIKSTGELALFNEIWDERPHVSEIAPHKPLYPKGHALWINQFSHLCIKGQYEAGRLDKRNIILKTPDEHTLWEHHKDRIFNEEGMILEHWFWVVERYEMLRKEYISTTINNQNKLRENEQQ